ncbi:MAG: hypothetical protein EOO09_04325 [Chitinophagaceae bacterium]|nr:MAG: hypothetical protein EOO09_04325 [Chitinophagaceae bacterium]
MDRQLLIHLLNEQKTTVVNRSIISMEGSSLLRVNIRFALVSLAVGAVINIFYFVFAPARLDERQFLCTFIFSLFITLSIANAVALFQSSRFAASSKFWVFVGGYYVFNIVGMLIGTELAFVVLNLFLRSSFDLRLHPDEYTHNFAIVMVVGTLVLLYYFQKADKLAALKTKENELIRLEQLQSDARLQALQSKINPHFLYNSLNSIASLIHENPDQAEEMTIRLSKLFRYSIGSSQDNLHSLEQELEILKTYIDIEQVRFGDRMKIYVHAGPGLEKARIPRFLVQPLVENAIKHGLRNVAGNAEIHVRVEKRDNRLVVAVYDNGGPFPEQMEMGYGIQSTYDKLRLLYKNEYDLQLVNQPKHILISIPFDV